MSEATHQQFSEILLPCNFCNNSKNSKNLFSLSAVVLKADDRQMILSRDLRQAHTIFGDFCDDNVCAWAVSTLTLLPVANLSPEMDSSTTISHKTRTFFM